MTTENFCFYLQNRLIQTSQTGGQWYSDTFPFSIPWSVLCMHAVIKYLQVWLGELMAEGCSTWVGFSLLAQRGKACVFVPCRPFQPNVMISCDVIKIFTPVINYHSMVIQPFCVIKLHYIGNYCGMAVNYYGICITNVINHNLT